MSKKQNVIIISFFLILIFGFTAGSLLVPEKAFSEKENRSLQQMPKVSVEEVLDGTFSKKYEKYLSDQFFERDGWISLKTTTDRMMGKQEGNGVYFAKDGFLIETHTGDFSGRTAAANLTTVANFVDAWKDIYSPEHLRVCLVPNAVDIYQDKLPAFVVNTKEQEYLEQMRQIIPSDYLLDVEELLLQNKEEQLFYRTDHHWTTYAARLVYKKWAQETGLQILPDEAYERRIVTEDFYGTVDAKVSTHVEPDRIEVYDPVNPLYYNLIYQDGSARESLYDLTYLEGRDKYAVFFGGNEPLIRAGSDVDNEKKLLVLKDSYANCFLSFAVQDFSRIDIIDLRYFNENLNEYLLKEEYTDILLLYNLSGFAQDSSISKLAMASGKGEA